MSIAVSIAVIAACEVAAVPFLIVPTSIPRVAVWLSSRLTVMRSSPVLKIPTWTSTLVVVPSDRFRPLNSVESAMRSISFEGR